ncbi:MAG: hypothetical protein ACRD2W_22365, partial [Acidimicrobiales bacterium]
MSLQTEYEFTLPKGYIDGDGNLHRTGVMRLATARDEIEPLRDPRVAQNEAYLTVAILARVVIELGTLPEVTTRTIEGLFATDLAYLQDLYGIINFGDPELLASLEVDEYSEPPAPASPLPPEPEWEPEPPPAPDAALAPAAAPARASRPARAAKAAKA